MSRLRPDGSGAQLRLRGVARWSVGCRLLGRMRRSPGALRKTPAAAVVATVNGLVSLALMVPRAEACSPDRCRIAYVAPLPGTTIPANAPALVLRPGPVFGEPTELPPFTLTDPTGRSVPARAARLGGMSSWDFAVRPEAELAAGDHVLKFERAEWCERLSPNPLESRFTVGPAAPLPQLAGTLRVGERSIEPRLMVNASISLCRTPIRAAVYPLVLEPSPELVPFLPITKFTVTVRAANASERVHWVQTHHGTYSHDIVAVNLRRSDQLFSACEYSSMWWDSGLRPGHYSGDLVAEVAGMAPLPPLSFELDVTECPLVEEPPSDPGPPVEPSLAESPETDGGQPALGEGMAGGGGCSCRVGGRPGSGGVGLLGLLGWLLVVTARRRG